MENDLDPFDDDHDDGTQCPRCCGSRTVDCHCGGDLCVCENYGEMDCPMCFGEGYVSDAEYKKYCERRAEFAKALKEAVDRPFSHTEGE